LGYHKEFSRHFLANGFIRPLSQFLLEAFSPRLVSLQNIHHYLVFSSLPSPQIPTSAICKFKPKPAW